MMIKYTAIPAMLLMPFSGSCQGSTNAPEPTLPEPLPACQQVDVVLRYSWDDLSPLGCDLTPPQILAVRIDETQADYDECHDSGGSILYDDEVYAIYCINIDY